MPGVPSDEPASMSTSATAASRRPPAPRATAATISGNVSALLYVRKATATSVVPTRAICSSSVVVGGGSVMTAVVGPDARSVLMPLAVRSATAVTPEVDQQREVVGEVPGDEELPAHQFAARRAHARRDLGIVQQVTYAEGRALHGVHGVPG